MGGGVGEASGWVDIEGRRCGWGKEGIGGDKGNIGQGAGVIGRLDGKV